MYLNITILYLVVAFISYAVCSRASEIGGLGITYTNCRPHKEFLIRHNWQRGNCICIGVFLSSLAVFAGGLAISVRLGARRKITRLTLASSALLAIIGITGMLWPAGPDIYYRNPDFGGYQCTSYHW